LFGYIVNYMYCQITLLTYLLIYAQVQLMFVCDAC